MPIYKILLPAEWDAFEAAGQFDGSPFDRSSGFIHLSSRDQVAETARRIFANESPLVIVAIDESVVAESLRWEATPDRGQFPHVYGTLPREAVVATFAVAGASDVDDALPPELAPGGRFPTENSDPTLTGARAGSGASGADPAGPSPTSTTS